MTKKFFYMMLLICGLSLFSSAKQVSIGFIKEYQEGKSSSVKKKPCRTKKIFTADVRPFQIYLFNI